MLARKTAPEDSASSGGEKKYESGMAALFRKELSDHLNSRRFYLMFALLLLATTASLAGGISSIVSSGGGDYVYLELFTTGSTYIYSFATFLAFLGPLAGIALGFDAVNNERSLGTLNRLVSQPIYRDSIINAKFLAGFAALGVMIFALGLYVCGVGIITLGLPPQAEEIFRILTFLLLTWVYTAFWLGLSILFSVLYRHAATAALCAIAIWLFLSLFMSLVAGGVANLIYPTDGIQGFFNTMSNYQLNLALNRISPYYLFSEAATTILSPSVRSIGVVTTSQLTGAVAGYLPFGQSLLLIWPHLVGMIALTMAAFACAYISFMRQEIRA